MPGAYGRGVDCEVEAFFLGEFAHDAVGGRRSADVAKADEEQGELVGWFVHDWGGEGLMSLVADTTVIDSNYEYQLPVIFHVLYNDKSQSSQYIPAARLKNLLQYVNEIYQGNIYGKSENLHLKFVLAEKDENGKTLGMPGVEYVKYDGEYPIDVNSFMSDNTGSKVKYIWDPNQYINVMMFNFKQNSATEVTLGISHMPYTVDNKVKGLDNQKTQYISKSQLKFPLCSAINSTYASTTPAGGYYQSDRYTNDNHQPRYLISSDVVVTLAHELGHYLGLFHAFTEKKEDKAFVQVDSCGHVLMYLREIL